MVLIAVQLTGVKGHCRGMSPAPVGKLIACKNGVSRQGAAGRGDSRYFVLLTFLLLR